MDQLAATQESFDLQLGELGCFPNHRRPGVVWVGVGGQLERLQTLYDAVEKLVGSLGWDPEGRSFHPHLTLGRVKDSRRLADARLQWGKVLEPRAIPVNALHFIESRLQPDGAVHTLRHTSCLQDDWGIGSLTGFLLPALATHLDNVLKSSQPAENPIKLLEMSYLGNQIYCRNAISRRSLCL